MMLTLLGIFYATMVAAGYIIEFLFGGLGLVPATRAAKVTDAGIQWNYTTILNIIFLLVAAALLIRFFRSGGAQMLKMMGGSPDGHEHHVHPSPEPSADAALKAYRTEGRRLAAAAAAQVKRQFTRLASVPSRTAR